MIIHKGNLQSFYEKHKTEITKLVALDQNTSFDIGSMEYCLVDLSGKKYYSFPESLALPLERMGKIEEYLQWITSGLTGDTISFLCDEMDKLLSDGLKTGKNASKIGLIISEIRGRKEMAIPVELMYNLLAVQLIREDENPEVFNNQIQIEKIIALKELNEQTGGFFFGLKELKQLQNLFNMSPEEWSNYWERSITQHRIRLEALMTVLHGKPSSESETTPISS